MHICVSKLSIIGSDNGLLPGRRQAIIWTNAILLLIGPRGTNFCEILIEIHIFSVKKMHLKMSSGKWRPFCLCLNVLIKIITWYQISNNLWIIYPNKMYWFKKNYLVWKMIKFTAFDVPVHLECYFNSMFSVRGDTWPYCWYDQVSVRLLNNPGVRLLAQWHENDDYMA